MEGARGGAPATLPQQAAEGARAVAGGGGEGRPREGEERGGGGERGAAEGSARRWRGAGSCGGRRRRVEREKGAAENGKVWEARPFSRDKTTPTARPSAYTPSFFLRCTTADGSLYADGGSRPKMGLRRRLLYADGGPQRKLAYADGLMPPTAHWLG